MKRIIKNNLLGFILGIIISGVTAYAVSNAAKDITFKAGNTNWKVGNVADALDSLYISRANNDYSIDEKVVGKWIDGKPLYQKVFLNVSFDTELLTNIDTVIEFRVSAHGTGSDIDYHDIGDGFSADSSKLYKLNDGVLTFASWSNNSGGMSKDADFIIIQYTKTTDSATNN